MVQLRPVLASDATLLFPGIHDSSVTDTIQWDGPASLEEYVKAIGEKEALHKEGIAHFFTILVEGSVAGSISLRPDIDFRADIGLWVTPGHQGRGARARFSSSPDMVSKWWGSKKSKATFSWETIRAEKFSRKMATSLRELFAARPKKRASFSMSGFWEFWRRARELSFRRRF
jgi:hypothetical protein